MSLVREEIAAQRAAVARVVADAGGAIAAAAADIAGRRPAFAVIAARGSSDNAARYAQHVLGRLCGLPVALALKIKELAGVAAEPASPADFLHGPIAMLDPGFPLLAILPDGPAGAAIRDVLAAARERAADITVIADADRAAAAGERLLAVEPVPEWLSPVCAVVPAQLLAVGAAEARGFDPDRPAGLQKVTRTT